MFWTSFFPSPNIIYSRRILQIARTDLWFCAIITTRISEGLNEKGAVMMVFRTLGLAILAGLFVLSGCAKQIDLDHEQSLLLDQDMEWSKAIAAR